MAATTAPETATPSAASWAIPMSAPPSAGPKTVPMLLSVFMIASARTVPPLTPLRTAWVWLPVQKMAREAPSETIAATNTGRLVEMKSRAYVAASSPAAPAIRDRSGKRARNHVTWVRAMSWTTADTAVRNPTLAAS